MDTGVGVLGLPAPWMARPGLARIASRSVTLLLKLFARPELLGSGLIDQSQKMTEAAMQIADMKVWAHRS